MSCSVPTSWAPCSDSKNTDNHWSASCSTSCRWPITDTPIAMIVGQPSFGSGHRPPVPTGVTESRCGSGRAMPTPATGPKMTFRVHRARGSRPGSFRSPASRAASTIRLGWSDSCRAGFAPAEAWRLSRRTEILTLRMRPRGVAAQARRFRWRGPSGPAHPISFGHRPIAPVKNGAEKN